MPPVTELATLLSTMAPVRHVGTFVYATLPDDASLDAACIVASVREPEGRSVVVAEEVATREGLRATFRCAWITLSVHSDLAAVGLTAAVATALTHAGISCNIVAGAYHDHLFVPVQRADDAMNTLQALQHESRRTASA